MEPVAAALVVAALALATRHREVRPRDLGWGLKCEVGGTLPPI